MTGIIKCRTCGTVLDNEVVYGYQKCECGAIALDVGRSVTRYIGDKETIQELTPEEAEEEDDTEE